MRRLCLFNIILRWGAKRCKILHNNIRTFSPGFRNTTVTSAHLRYFCFQVIFDAAEGATPASLRQFVSRVSDIPLNQLNVAKYFREKYDWLPIMDALTSQVCQT